MSGTEGATDQNAKYTKIFMNVFRAELVEIQKRRRNLPEGSRRLIEGAIKSLPRKPCEQYQLVGLCLSGGGIRSAAVNTGVMQVLNQFNLLPWVDYLSTVSGGGYLGTGVSTFMRSTQTIDWKAQAEEFENYDLAKSFRPPACLLGREMTSRLRHDSKWVNVSDGGHIENLGAIELLRKTLSLDHRW